MSHGSTLMGSGAVRLMSGPLNEASEKIHDRARHVWLGCSVTVGCLSETVRRLLK